MTTDLLPDPTRWRGETIDAWQNVKAHGARGGRDATKAFQRAIDALEGGVGIVYIPPDAEEYVVSEDLVLPVLGSGGIYLRGGGVGASRISYTGDGWFTSIGDGGATDARRTYIEDLTLTGTGAATGAVQFNHTRFCGLRRMFISGFTGADATVHILGGVHNYFNEIESCQIREGTAGIRLDGGSGIGANSNYIRHCHFGVHTNAVHIDAGDSNVIEANEFNGSITKGVLLGGNAVGNKIFLNQFDGPTTAIDVSSSAVTDTVILSAVALTISDVGTRTLVLDATQLLLRTGNVSKLSLPTASGALITQSGIQTHEHSTFKADVGGNSVVVTIDGAGVAAATLLRILGAASQSGALTSWRNSGGTELAAITASGAMRLLEQADPAAPAANNALLYARDNGAGKTELCVRFPTGAVQVLATEP